MRFFYSVLLLVIMLACHKEIAAQIPRNVDSIKSKYDSALAGAGKGQPKMIFHAAVNDKQVKGTWKDFGYMEADGKKSDFVLDQKNEAWTMPAFSADSVKLFYSGKSCFITSDYLKSSYVLRGGSVYFGTINNFRQLLQRAEKDEDYNTWLSNNRRGLFAVLSNARARKAAADRSGPFTLYYCVLQSGEGQVVSFYIK